MSSQSKSGLAPVPPLPTPGPGGEAAAKASVGKAAVLAVVVVVLLAGVYLSPLRGYLGRWHEVGGRIRGLGIAAPWVLTAGVAVLVAVGVPRLVLCLISGMALGFWQGLLWAQLGTLIGNYVTFLGARFGGREWAERYVSTRGRLHGLLRREGIKGVILARQVPVPGLLINLACGLLPIRHRHFLIGTIIGQLPEAIPCTLVGAGVLQDSGAKSAGIVGLGIMLAVASWLALKWFRGRQPRE